LDKKGTGPVIQEKGGERDKLKEAYTTNKETHP
jgi:hypothetical protein